MGFWRRVEACVGMWRETRAEEVCGAWRHVPCGGAWRRAEGGKERAPATGGGCRRVWRGARLPKLLYVLLSIPFRPELRLLVDSFSLTPILL